MKNLKIKLFSLFIITSLTSCLNSDKKSDKNEKATSTITKEKRAITQKITPCLWVDKDAKAVADYYLSIFKEGKFKEYHKYQNPAEGKEQGGQDSFDTAIIEIGDIELSILAAGPYFKFNEAVSMVVNCKDQAEVDYYWAALTANGGEEGSCGWCKDKYGLSWQVVPVEYFDLINSSNPAIREKAMKNTFKQKKIILSELK